MEYENIWKKVLGDNEKVEYQFSIGEGFIKFGLIVGGLISFILILFKAYEWAVIVFAITFIYFKYYLKAANAYAFTNKRVIIHRGWLSTHTISIDYSKITDIHIIEPIFDKVISNTGNIAIITAGTTRDQVVLKNIEAPYEVKKRLDTLKD